MAEISAQAVVFHRAKVGSTEAEWEDCAGYDAGAADRPARYIVVDGATEAYDSLRWVRQLVTSFLGTDGDAPPALTEAGLDNWFARMQQRWVDEAPRAFANIFEERKFQEGSFATFLGCEIHGLGGGSEPVLSVAALGDAVLFHVRGRNVIEQLPRLAPEEFGINPEGVFTQPSERQRMRTALQLTTARLQVGDRLFLATDALAQWLAGASRANPRKCWDALAEIEHPADFRRFVARARNGRDGLQMKNDDVTLLRVEITPSDADVLVVCR
jgi:hypothetical protein